MPVTTRIQADAEGITDEDMVSLENPPQEVEAAGGPGDAEPAQFDEKEAYHPLFCISDNLPEEVSTTLCYFSGKTSLSISVLHLPQISNRGERPVARDHHK